MKKHPSIVYLVCVVLLVGLVWFVRSRINFQWSIFWDQLQHLDWKRIAFAVAAIWFGYVLRALRWELLIKPKMKVRPLSLFGSQVIGFTAVALFGRFADLVRPYLISRRTGLSLSCQVAVYTVERMFDLGAMALIFSGALLLASDRAALPHHEALEHTALGGLIVALGLAAFALTVRASGKAIARGIEKVLAPLSSSVAQSIARKILAFHDGLDAIASVGDFLWAMALSLAMWGLITVAYLETTRAFVLSPELKSMTLARCMVLMAASMVGSVVQLPVVGWFTQIGVTTGVMQSVFHTRFEPALGCGAMLLIVTFMSVIPLGLAWARIEHVSLRKVSQKTEELAEVSGGLAQ